jgi:hypothetical protein
MTAIWRGLGIRKIFLQMRGCAGGWQNSTHSVYSVLREGALEAAGPAYLEIIDFIAAGTTPEPVVNYRPSLEAQQRVAELIAREKEESLTPEEKSELDHFVELEHILRMAKARALQIRSRD